ncbi:MAG TPA: lasso peptide biosynthesis B2 protein [Chloroflexia bacterium]|nr:lasso peptide biosynthesis B2 protein [Chloroflexia bacterium]
MWRRRLTGVGQLLAILAWMGALPVLKYLLPLRTLVRIMWAAPRPRPPGAGPPLQTAALIRRLYTVPRRVRDANCLERSLLTYRFLARQGVAPQLVIGMRRAPGGVLGHVWVLVDQQPVGESGASVQEFRPVAVFGARGQVQAPGR